MREVGGEKEGGEACIEEGVREGERTMYRQGGKEWEG